LTGPKEFVFLQALEGMPLAKHLPTNLKVIVAKRHPALLACEAAGMEFLLLLGLQALPLDAGVARLAQRAVEPVIVLPTVGIVVDDVEVGRLEGRFACFADET